ncbi:hypothetical protein VIN7_6902 [Saccharomyces cerevisiae x Saccharomyces kudriavzevii VIN7]|uniref:Uncharacterized protein n=1 Tax=Saccharomyces cerevisiae x Saccharomyces kudriavzevii (strain VIN7) TaxID=1095631 RepID=H0GUC3_SACCK|nr:hypothetical protein VIN7_6902 [Saccharomyces cerevisiae x Saccharomyces kudriavzevii VIN7]
MRCLKDDANDEISEMKFKLPSNLETLGSIMMSSCQDLQLLTRNKYVMYRQSSPSRLIAFYKAPAAVFSCVVEPQLGLLEKDLKWYADILAATTAHLPILVILNVS